MNEPAARTGRRGGARVPRAVHQSPLSIGRAAQQRAHAGARVVVACGDHLAGQLRGAEEAFEEIEGPAGEERATTGASFAAYVEATAEAASNFDRDAFPTTFGVTLPAMPEVVRAAGRVNANNLCAREEAFRAERLAAAAAEAAEAK